MVTLIAAIHIIVAFLLIGLVLIQDSKGGGLGIGGGGGGSSSLLGATGAQTLAAKLTRWTGAIFAVTCISLSVMTAHQTQSVVDIAPASAPQQTAPAESAPAPEAAPETETAPQK